MGREQDLEVCEFVREILAVRTGEPIRVTSEPEKDRRDIAAVEQMWGSASFRYAVEHTQIEAFDGQIHLEATVLRLLTPIRNAFCNVLPGNFRLIVEEKDTKRLPLAQYDVVRSALASAIARVAPTLAVGQIEPLRISEVPFVARLRRLDGPTCQLLIESIVDVDPHAARRDRMLRAVAKKLPKLEQWSQHGALSVLVLESSDIQHSNVQLTYAATRVCLEGQQDVPDIIALVETDSGVWFGHVLKELAKWGDAVPRVNGVGFYTRGQVAGLPLLR